MIRPELLAPAGSLEKLKFALIYGADSVYIGGEEFSLRVAAENFSLDDIKEGIAFAHNMGKKVYITANIIPHNEDIEKMEAFLKEIRELSPDGIIVSDLGVFDMCKKYLPDTPIHISTQANNLNYASANMWSKLGAKRVILARELSLDEIKEIRENTPPALELECFVHGAMCISYSGRCLLSNYMTERDANMGACSHPCRWNYSLMEQTRPNEYMPVFENERGTFIYNSKDLCLIRHIPGLINAGVSSFKIEGRVKTPFYVATIVKMYRKEIDRYMNNPSDYTFDESSYKELEKVSHRLYTTGFIDGKPSGSEQVYATSSYIRKYDFAGVVIGYDEQSNMAIISQRNKIMTGDKIEFMPPSNNFFEVCADNIYDENNNLIHSTPHAEMIYKIKVPQKIEPWTIVRKNKAE